MAKYDHKYDEGDNDRNEDRNNEDNAVPGSDGPIFNPITMPRSRLGIVEEDWVTTVT